MRKDSIPSRETLDKFYKSMKGTEYVAPELEHNNSNLTRKINEGTIFNEKYNIPSFSSWPMVIWFINLIETIKILLNIKNEES